MKINNDSRWNTCTIAHKHKHSHFRSKATGLRDLSSILKHGPTCVHLSTWQHTDRPSSYASTVSCPPVCSHRASVLIAELTTQPLCSLCLVSAVGVTLQSASPLLTARGAAGEEVSGHLALPLHLDNTSTVQLVSVVDQHVVQVGGHLRENTDIWHPECETLNPSEEKYCLSQFHIE